MENLNTKKASAKGLLNEMRTMIDFLEVIVSGTNKDTIEQVTYHIEGMYKSLSGYEEMGIEEPDDDEE